MSTRAPSLPRRATRSGILHLVLTGAGFVLAVVLAVPALRVPAHVEQVTVSNPHPWPVHVQASRPGDAVWQGVGHVDQHSQQAFHALIDQGDVWVFRFGYAGLGTELRVSRAQLERDGWRVAVPDDLGIRLRDAGVTEAPAG